ncbi:hypothetical protein O181_039979 [Austropuccinia psidii MF-1]|uniref:Integrase zinc-binding domain-containing protein n=1 Tax=Austropuccinia psidii MF-1 TaxID=1389203 RepID=A0A9Q3DBI3_9BASI|nr:hypothetical protein [Austropuccinia psidii MF-1]
MTLKDRTLINTLLHECYDSVLSGHVSEDRKLERVKNCSWWPNWRNDVAEYFQTCDRCTQENRATGKKCGMMIQIPMDWVTALPPGGDRSFNEFVVLVDRYRKPPMFLPFHKDETYKNKEIIIWNRLISN